MKKIVTTTLLLLLTSSLLADEKKALNTTLRVSTLGLGFDVSSAINSSLSVRFNLNGASYTDSQKDGNNEFEGTLDLLTAGLLVDYYPFENNFRFSTGAYYNGNEFMGTTSPSVGSNVNLNGNSYDMSQIVSLDTKITFDTIAPYFGIGWGNNAKDSGWGFTFDLGAMYHGVGEAKLTANGLNSSLSNQAVSDLLLEEENINDDLEDFQFYPVVSIGVNYSF